MSRIGNWTSTALRALGLDAASLGKMNPVLKWSGALLMFIFIVAVIFEVSGIPEQKTTPPHEYVQQVRPALEQAVAQNGYSKKIASVLGWVCVVSFGLAILLQPKEPKRDGRFKTGYKNNATVRKLSPGLFRIQISAAMVGVISGLLWDYLK